MLVHKKCYKNPSNQCLSNEFEIATNLTAWPSVVNLDKLVQEKFTVNGNENGGNKR